MKTHAIIIKMARKNFSTRMTFSITDSDKKILEHLSRTHQEPIAVVLRKLIRDAGQSIDKQDKDIPAFSE